MGGGAPAGAGSLFRVGDNVPLSRVLAFLSLLVVGVVIFEHALHRLEHRARRFPKYAEMLSKAYRELMILGVISFFLKMLKEIPSLNPYSASMIAFQVADLSIFLLAITLIAQAAVVFLLLRRRNLVLERAELTSTRSIAEGLAAHSGSKGCDCRWWPLSWCRRRQAAAAASTTTANTEAGATDAQPAQHTRTSASLASLRRSSLEELARLRVLRHLFLRRYGLPELFPFSKYLRQAQDNQITHMIDVDVSSWVLLLAVAWGLEGATELVGNWSTDGEPYALVVMFLLFSWALVIIHAFVASYFERAVYKLLRAGGYDRKDDPIACLQRIGEDEAQTLRHELAGDALHSMQAVQERLEAERLTRKRHHHHHRHHDPHDQHHKADAGLQILATLGRHLRRRCCAKKPKTPVERQNRPMSTMSSGAASGPSFSAPGTALSSTMSSSSAHEVQAIELRWYSRKGWHFVVILLLMLNGLYVALMFQCILHQLRDVQEDFGTLAIIAIPVPMLVNVLVLQPEILQNFMIVSSIFRVDVPTLSDVVSHFSEIIELRSEFATTLLARMHEHGHTSEDLQRALEARDRRRTGRIPVHKLRDVLRLMGLPFSQFRFNIVARLLFRLDGTMVEYHQVLRLVAVAQHNDEQQQQQPQSHGVAACDLDSLGQHFHTARRLLVPQLSGESAVGSVDDGNNVDDNDAELEDGAQSARSVVAPMLARGPSGLGRKPSSRPGISRKQSSFQLSTTRTVRMLFHLDSDHLEDAVAESARVIEDSSDLSLGDGAAEDGRASPRSTTYVRM